MMSGNVSKKNQVSPEWGVKGKSKHALYLGETAMSVHITDTHQSAGYVVSEHGAQTSPAVLRESQPRLAKKTEGERQGWDVLTDGTLCVACWWLNP